MARRPRLFVPGLPLHLIQRGNNRQPCFFAERDYIVYLHKLREFSRRFDVAIHSFVLMTNHVHLVVTPQHANGPSQMLHALGAYFVRFINSTYKRTGTLWEGRFKASLVDSDSYFLTLCRYVELNPVRAGMVEHPAAYRWSSYQSHAMGKTIALLTPHPLYLALGTSADQRLRAYRELFSQHIPPATLDEIRQATNKAWVLGDDDFKQKVEQKLGRQLPPFARGGDRKSPPRSAQDQDQRGQSNLIL